MSAEKCMDCGTAERWEWSQLLGSGGVLCRKCHVKAGYSPFLSVDLDRFPLQLARQIVALLPHSDGAQVYEENK